MGASHLLAIALLLLALAHAHGSSLATAATCEGLKLHVDGCSDPNSTHFFYAPVAGCLNRAIHFTTPSSKFAYGSSHVRCNGDVCEWRCFQQRNCAGADQTCGHLTHELSCSAGCKPFDDTWTILVDDERVLAYQGNVTASADHDLDMHDLDDLRPRHLQHQLQRLDEMPHVLRGNGAAPRLSQEEGELQPAPRRQRREHCGR